MIDAKKDNVIVEVLIKGKTSGGLILPEIATEPQKYGRVMSVGAEVKYYKKGDIVVFHTNGGQSVLLESKLLGVLKENEVYGILTDKNIMDTLVELNLKSEEKKVVTL